MAFFWSGNCAHSAQSILSKINAFQLRLLRSILGLETTFRELCSMSNFRTSWPRSEIVRIVFLIKRVALSSCTLRSPDSDPLRQVTYVAHSADAYPIGKRRVGAPRQQWRHFTHRHAWKFVSDGRTDYDNTDQQNLNGSRTRFLSCRSASPRTLERPWPEKKTSTGRTREICLP